MSDQLEVLIRAGIAIFAVIAMTRLAGLRSFSKMSEFEFAVTVAIGSVVAGMITAVDKSLSLGLIALGALFVLQLAIAWLRLRWPIAQKLVDNEPKLLMENGKLLHDNLRDVNVTEADVWGKLREANALQLHKVHAVILESTGDISVLHGDADIEIADELLKDVCR